MKNLCLTVILALLSVACTTQAQSPSKGGMNPGKANYLPWTISHIAPDHMESYLNGIAAFDVNRKMSSSILRGSPSMRHPAPGNEIVGWPANPGYTGVTPVNLDLPKVLILSWRSFVEQQEYHVQIEVPEEARSQMKISHRIDCLKNDGRDHYYRNNLVVGMAPGGVVKLWINGPCLNAIEIGRFVASKVKPDPAREGYATRALSKETEAYLKANPIPFGSW